MKKKLLIIGTGGTIASITGDAGLTPGTDVTGLLSCVPQAAELCDWEQIQLFSLDSTNVGPAQWVSLAKCICRSYQAYDGFLILHGTDTMAYTAAALSYLIQNSGKPIVLTGSQKPMEDTDTDAKRNIEQSIRYAVSDHASDVVIVFDGKVIPGGRARKVKSRSFDAFATVGFCDRAFIQNGTITEQYFPKEKIFRKTEFFVEMDPNVIDVKITPGLNPQMLLPLLEQYRGIVLEGFGLGGLPEYGHCDWFPVIQKLIQSGVTVAVTTQVPEEGSDMSIYEVGKKYIDNLDILEGGTMTSEAMVVKLMWILGQTKEPKKVRDLFYKKINYDRI
ncbi:MAG: asparaginase [Lachnospiraceae bacterium]|nr:asparaginase [Lachnospiraceae bacterium]